MKPCLTLVLSIGLIGVAALPYHAAANSAAPNASDDERDAISRADLDYTTPASRSEEGMPVGNGRMGSLVWTTPTALKFQINRVDVFAEHAASISFPRADTDYASGCGYLDLNVVQSGDDVFAGDAFHQHLSIYDALMTAQGRGVTARVLAWNERDVMAVEIDDQRATPEPIAIDLRMLRYAIQGIPGKNFDYAANHIVAYQTAQHTAFSQLHVRDGRIALTQKFVEGDFYDASAVAVSVVGRAAKATYLNNSTVQLCAAPGRGRFTVLIASAASFDPKADIAALADRELDAAQPKAFDELFASNQAWWRDFWAKGRVHLHSADGQADFVEENYTYFLYLMGSTSRGKYPPRFGGVLWYTNGDMRRWGSQYWWANQSAYYSGLMPANRLELMDPLFSMYSGMYDSCALAARQQWGSEGIWIPEIVFFDGLEKLPDDIAAELQDLMLVRKPYEQRSAKFQAFAEVRNRHHARWNFQDDGKWVDGHFIVPTKGKGIFGHCTHILGSGVRIATLYWQKYQYTGDKTWLRDRAYPMIKGLAEFYHHFPNFKKEADGFYHIHHVNNGESPPHWDSSDTVYEVNCLHTIFPLAISASELLGVDTDLRAQWQEIDTHLVALPSNDYAGGWRSGFVYGGPGAIEPQGEDKDLKTHFLNFNRLGGFVDDTGIGGAKIFRNRMRLREGPGAIDAENLGALAANIHQSLLKNTAAQARDAPVLQLFAAWPKDWDADFSLRAPGAFVVSAARQHGEIARAEIVSEAGSDCTLRNPWPGHAVVLTRDGRVAEKLEGDALHFPTRRGERIQLAAAL